MKKLFAILLALFVTVAVPEWVLAEGGKYTASIDENKPIKKDGVDGNFYDIVLTTDDETATISTAEFTFAWESAVTEFSCVEVDGWTVTETKDDNSRTDKCVYTASEEKSGTTLTVGQIKAVINKDAAEEDCSITFTFDGATVKINPPTGSFVSYVIVGAGIVAAVAAYAVSKKKSKLYNL